MGWVWASAGEGWGRRGLWWAWLWEAQSLKVAVGGKGVAVGGMSVAVGRAGAADGGALVAAGAPHPASRIKTSPSMVTRFPVFLLMMVFIYNS